MTPELTAALSKAKTSPRSRTSTARISFEAQDLGASIAKARGLQPLATAIFRRTPHLTPRGPPRTTSTMRSPMSARRWLGHRILLPRRFR